MKAENTELRADVKFLMDQNSVLMDNIASKSTEFEQKEILDASFLRKNSQQSIIPEVSTLMANFNELFKLTRDKSDDVKGIGKNNVDSIISS